MIDISNWKEFKVPDIFVTEKHGASLQTPTGAMMSKKDLQDGDIPRVTVSNFNNGITGYYADSDNKNYRTYENFISVSFLGTVFYQPDKVSLDMKVHCLKPLNYELNAFSAGYIVSIIRKAISNYAYSDQLSSTVLAELKFNLPATPDGQPDWAYMESYMKKIMEETEEYIRIVGGHSFENHPVDVSEWGEFRVGDLFNVSISRSVDKIKLNFDKNGRYDFVGRTPINNGIQGKINKLDFAPNKAGAFSVTQIGERLCQYRENDWYASQNIFILNPLIKEIERVPIFITTILTEMLKRIYGNNAYSKYPTLKTLPNDIIKLPITPSGEPDWQYMEEYMKSVMKDQERVMERLEKEIA